MALPSTRFRSLRRLQADLWQSLLHPSPRTAPLLVSALGSKLPSSLRELRPPLRPFTGRRRFTPSLFKLQLLAWARLRQFYRLPRSRPLRRLRRRCGTGRNGHRLLMALESRLVSVPVRAGLLCTTTVSRQPAIHGRLLQGGRRCRSPGAAVAPGTLVRLLQEPTPSPLGIAPHLEVSWTAAAALMVRPPRPSELFFPFDPHLEDLLSRP